MTISIRRSTLLAAILLLAFAAPVFAQDYAEPGTCESSMEDATLCDGWGNTTNKSSAVQSLTPYASTTGNIFVSTDAVGTNNANGAFVQVEKPSNAATVRAAFLMAASTGFQGASIVSGVTISRGANILTVTPTDYDLLVNSSINSRNGIKDITTFIANDLDPAPAGTYDYLVVESSTTRMDGEVLVVIFNEPSAPSSTYVLTFGAQNIAGDNFNVTLGSPFSDADVDITMSLGISYGAQGSVQYSIVNVNGERLTTSAGGEDDGVTQNGALITVGGIGDDPANPADPLALPTNERSDDELYTIDPFLDDGDTQINIFSQNPSNDDNIFFAGFLIRGSAAVIGEGILLTPPDDVNPVNTTHTVTAFVQDDNGDPITGRDVDFEITSGPNVGLTGSGVTDANGEATFSWMSTTTGTDVVEASFLTSQDVRLSTTASKTWEESTGQCDLPQIVSEEIDNVARTITLVYEDADGITEIKYRYPADYPDATKAGMPALENLSVSDGGGMTSSDGIDWTASSPYPTTVTHVLQAAGPGRVLYFPLITDACQDPGPQTYDADPIRSIAASAAEVPSSLTLEGNYPNPFNPSTTVRFALPEQSDVTLEIFDLLGRRVASLLNRASLSAGPHEVRFDASGLPSGTYLFRVEAAGEVVMGRMTYMK